MATRATTPIRRFSPMPTQCSADLFGFAPVEGRRVEAGLDGGTITSDAGALLLGATDRVVDLVGRLAGCFVDARRPDLIEHDVATLSTTEASASMERPLAFVWTIRFPAPTRNTASESPSRVSAKV